MTMTRFNSRLANESGYHFPIFFIDNSSAIFNSENCVLLSTFKQFICPFTYLHNIHLFVLWNLEVTVIRNRGISGTANLAVAFLQSLLISSSLYFGSRPDVEERSIPIEYSMLLF